MSDTSHTIAFDPEQIARTTAGLIAIPSLGGQEGPALDHIADWLGARGVTVTRQQVGWDRLRAHPLASAEVEREAVEVLVAEVAGDRPGPTLLLNAHVDVVPADQQAGWSGDPRIPVRTDAAGRPDVAGAWLRGRGAADTKGGLAAAMHVLAALAADGGPPAGRVLLTPVVGEEDGGCGTLATILAGVTADAAVVIEPTDLTVARSCAGALSFRVTVEGRTAHGSVRHLGVSAIEKALPLHRRLLDLEAERAASLRHSLYDAAVPFPLCIGRIEGGDYRCDEAAWAVLEGRFGTPPDEAVADSRAALEAAVSQAASADAWLAEHPPAVEWIGAQWVGGDTPADDRIVTLMTDLVGGDDAGGVSYGCDLGLLRQVAGIPGVVYGPGSAGVAHAPDERVLVSDLGRCAVTLHQLAQRFCEPGAAA